MRVESIEDILRVLEAHPEWRLKLLQVLGMSELVYLPARLEAYQQENREQLEAFRRETREQLEAYQQETRERFERLENAIAQLMEAVAESRRVEQRLEAGLEESRRIEQQLAAGLEESRRIEQRLEAGLEEARRTGQRLEAVVEELRQMTQRLEAGLEEARRTGQRLEAVVEELRQMTQRLEAGLEESRRIEQRLEAGLEESRRVERELREAIEDLRQTTQQIAEEQKQMRQVQEKLLKDVGILKGSDRERYYRERAHAIFGRYLRKVQLINMGDLLDEVESRTEISDEEADELMSADAIFSAVKKKTREPVYVVLKASWAVEESDMERAIRRAAILQRLGYPAVPVVGGVEVATPVIRAATEGSVVLALDGKVLGETLLA